MWGSISALQQYPCYLPYSIYLFFLFAPNFQFKKLSNILKTLFFLLMFIFLFILFIFLFIFYFRSLYN